MESDQSAISYQLKNRLLNANLLIFLPIL